MSLPFGETVTVQTPAGTDRYGDPLPVTTRTVAGCAFAPRSSTEGSRATGARTTSPNTVITGVTLYAPPDADIGPADVVVRSDGSRWSVVGEPGVWQSPLTGWNPGVEVALTRVEG